MVLAISFLEAPLKFSSGLSSRPPSRPHSRPRDRQIGNIRRSTTLGRGPIVLEGTPHDPVAELIR
jgi:hypothetical protein